MALADRFRLVRLTREDLLLASKRADHAQWGAPGLLGLDLAQYQDKERTQRETPFAQRGSMYWALVDRSPGDDPASDSDAGLQADTVVFHCLCKTHRFDCAFRRRSGELAQGFAFQVGSVFTRPESRKQGLASFFLSLVRERLRQQPGALLSALYSIIGPDYYARLGWQLYPSTIATIDVEHPRNAAVATANSQAQFEKLFLDASLTELLASDNRRLVEQLGSDQFDGREAFAILPTRDSIEWQFCVGVVYARAHGYAELPTLCGVRLRGSDAFVVWCHNLKESALYIARAHLPDAAAAVPLLQAALKEAQAFKLRKIVVWNPQEALASDAVLAQLQVEHGPREMSSSSAVVFDGSNDPDDLPVWLANERFAWV